MKASAMPTEQMKRYFQDASSEWRVLWTMISGAERSVVASMKIQINPRWFARVTPVIAKRVSKRKTV